MNQHPANHRQVGDNQHYYQEMPEATSSDESHEKKLVLTTEEILLVRRLLGENLHKESGATAKYGDTDVGCIPESATSADSEYSEFPETTHAWAVFADKPQRKANVIDRVVGTLVIIFQVFTYSLFVFEAIEDYQKKSVPVMTTHENCQAYQEEPNDNFTCEAEYTSTFDALVAFSMLSIFLTPEILQAVRVIRATPLAACPAFVFACLAAIEVIFAFVAAAIAISYRLYIGEVTDAIEVGVGLLFVRELSARCYQGIRHKGVKQYGSFLGVLALLLVIGFSVEGFCESFFAS